MSLDFYLKVPGYETIFDRNITHNLNTMALAFDLYNPLWRPEEIGAIYARDIIKPLTKGLEALKASPAIARKYEPSNGWGTYEALVEFTEAVLHACIEEPDSIIKVSR